MLILFGAAQVISYIDVKRTVPVELYPIATLALGYLLGYRMLRDNGKKK